MLPTFRSLPDPPALSTHLGPQYGLTFEHCELRRSLVNDVYELSAGGARYVLKLYLHGWREADEIRWETGLAAHLLATGVRTTQALAMLDGDTVGLLETPEGPRPFTLLRYVEGTTPRPPFTDELYYAFGREVAAFHDAADNYTSPYFRPPAEDAEQALEQILAVDSAEENLLRGLMGRVRNNLAQYSKAGTCHGDVSMDNVLLTQQGLLLLDFDLAAPGPPAADFCGVATTPHWPAFKAGYRTRREITAEDEAAIPYLQIVARILNLRFHLVDKPRFRGTESRGEGWAAAEYDALRTLAHQT